jgi:hypothetical protein
MILVVSCQKDLVKTGDSSPRKSIYDSQKFPEPNAESKADEERIVKFSNLLKKLSESTSSFSTTTNEMQIPETVWNVEALLNASYASAGEPFRHSSVTKDSILVALNSNGAIDESSLPAVYGAMRAKLGEQYQGITGDNKNLIFVDIEYKGIVSTVNLGSSLEMANFELTSFTGYGYPPEDIPFTVGDNWRWGNLGGRCNPTTGAPNGIDTREGATTVLTRQLNIRYPKLDNRYYFIDIQTTSDYVDYNNRRNPNDPILDNNRDYLIYQVTNELPLNDPGLNFDKCKCINFDDMNWYYQNYFDKITYGLNLYPGKSFMSINVVPDGHLHQDPGSPPHDVLFHKLTITYGKFHSRGCRLICSCTDGTCVPDPNCFQSQ